MRGHDLTKAQGPHRETQTVHLSPQVKSDRAGPESSDKEDPVVAFLRF